MHNFTKPSNAVADSLVEVGKSLHSPKKEFFASNKATLEASYLQYDVLAGKDELHTLAKIWETKPSDDDATNKQKEEKRALSNQLYGDDRPFVNKHWENLKNNNGGGTLYCPICGLRECEEIDHFVPRDEKEFPEYSAHLSNLIPLCHNCNHKKSSKFLDGSGKRIFFNAFYDVLFQRDILSCSISISPVDGLPQVDTTINATLSYTRKPDMYILSTIGDLKLMKRFQSKAKEWLKHEMNRLALRKGQSWDVIKDEFAAMAVPTAGDPDIVHPAVFKAISESADMENWFKSL